MADKLFREYYNELTEVGAIPANGKMIVQTGTGEPERVDVGLLPVEYSEIIDLGTTSGTVVIDWSKAIKHKITLNGNTTLQFTNFLPYEGIKVQEIEIYSNNNAHTLTFPTGVDLNDIANTPIDFALNTTGNHLSFRVLNNTPYFQTANYVKQV